MKKFPKTLAYSVLGVSSFLFFFYLTFPYEVLKETLVLKISETTNLSIEVDELGPAFPLGLKGQGIKISGSSYNLKFKSVVASVSIFSLLVGKTGINIELEDSKDGFLEFKVAFGILDLIRSEYRPTNLYLNSKKFYFGPLVDFVLNQQAQAPDVNLMVKPWLESVGFTSGNLNADIDLSINHNDLKQSEGTANVKLDNTVLKSLNPNLPIPDQSFSKASIMSKLKNGMFTISEKSGFISQDLIVNITGDIQQKPQIMKSVVNFTFGIEMGKPLHEQFGIIFNALAQKETNGKFEIRMQGALSPQPNVTFH